MTVYDRCEMMDDSKTTAAADSEMQARRACHFGRDPNLQAFLLDGG